MYSSDLSKKIVQIEQEIREFKTSQFLGSGSGILIPVRAIDWTWTTTGNYMGRVLVFDSKSSFFPLITPYLTATINGSPTTEVQATYDFFGAAAGSNFPSVYSPSNPRQSMCAIEFLDNYPYSSGDTIRITGMVYANCYGTLRVFNNGNEET